MPAPDELPFDGDDFDPDSMLWSPGVDYVGGWRDATDAAAELLAALSAVGIDTTTITARATTTARGQGLVRLTIPTPTTRALTTLTHFAATRSRAAS